MISAWICKVFYSSSSHFTSEERQDFCCLVLALCLHTMFSLCSQGPTRFIIRARIQAAPSILAKIFFKNQKKTCLAPSQSGTSLLPQLCRLRMMGKAESNCLPLSSTANLSLYAQQPPAKAAEAPELPPGAASPNLFVDNQGLQQPQRPTGLLRKTDSLLHAPD